MLYIECQILNNGVPILTKLLVAMIENVFIYYSIESTSTSIAIIQSMTLSLHFCSYLLQLYGLFNQVMLYAWNGFDPHWIAAGIGPDKRYISIYESIYLLIYIVLYLTL
jgi:hypothetical protein